MTAEQKRNSEAFPQLPPPPPPPPMDTTYTYNRLAHRVLTNPDNRAANIAYLKDLYSKMNSNQKREVESIKNIQKKLGNENWPETGFIKIKGVPHYYVTIDKQTKFYNKEGFEVNKDGDVISKTQINASDIIPNQYITKIYSNDKVMVVFKDNKPNRKKDVITIPPPPPPPPTKAAPYKNGKKKTLNEIIKETPKGVEAGYELLENGESHYYTVYRGKKNVL